MSEWVAWIEPTDRWGDAYDPPRRYVASVVRVLKLTPSRGLAARYATKDQAERVAEMAARENTPYGVEEVRAPGRLGAGEPPAT